MKIRITTVSALIGATLLTAVPGFSHHSNVAFEVTKVITVTGVVRDFDWVNPHTWIYLKVDDGKGGTVEWKCEGRAPGVLSRAGWTRHSVKPGDTVTIDMSPAKDGSKTSLIARVTKSDGTILANAPPPTQ
jgi:hypothetical protein